MHLAQKSCTAIKVLCVKLQERTSKFCEEHISQLSLHGVYKYKNMQYVCSSGMNGERF